MYLKGHSIMCKVSVLFSCRFYRKEKLHFFLKVWSYTGKNLKKDNEAINCLIVNYVVKIIE